jgi:sialate O-acetylesterase
MKPSSFTILVAALLRATAANATVTPNPLFSDHAVLQQGTPVPIWGTAAPGEGVTVEMAGHSVHATATQEGKWMLRLPALQAGGPFTLTITGENKIVLSDILVGEVWLAGGQSNMERPLGPRAGQPPIAHWKQEVAAAKYPSIRQFGVAQKQSFTPVETVEGHWEVCSPDTVTGFTAVGYFFARDLYRARGVPIGLIHSSWGGTPAEAWTSMAGLRGLPDFAQTPEQIKQLVTDLKGTRDRFQAQMETWFAKNDSGSGEGRWWYAPPLDTSTWKSMTLPTLWENAGEPDLNGVVWFRKVFEVPAGADGTAAELDLGMVDDSDTTWVNGVRVGFTFGYNLPRRYVVPAGVLEPGRNVVAVRVLDTGGGGGIWGDRNPRLVWKGRSGATDVDLGGPWQYRVGMNLRDGPWPPSGLLGDNGTPTVLWNGMIAPLVPYALRGVIWYQGEANVQRELQYRTLFPALIADWRRAWGNDNLPFLFVQIAPHRDMTPELREAQLLTWQHTPGTAMVVTTDCGDANDIHPARKQPVGARLALAARALAYGETVEYSGPTFAAMTIAGRKALLRFTHVDGGLVARGARLEGFTVAGPDKVFFPAWAELRGRTVVVTSRAVPNPVAVRYGWANVPTGNLFNKVGLPASPFRTDAH